MAASERLDLPPWIVAREGQEVAKWFRRIGVVLAVTTVVAVSAQLAVPIPGTPVPVTLQDLAVLAVGVLLGPVRGGIAMASYLVIGAMGAPVFSNGNGGLPWLVGPTGGYLLAFPLAAFVIGHASHRGRLWTLVLGVIAAQCVVFTCGVGQLAWITGSNLRAVIDLGLVPFLPGMALKSVLITIFGTALAAHRGGRSGGCGPTSRECNRAAR
jgi:biotin transport system substrate-specific component